MILNYDPLLNYVSAEDVALNEYIKLEYKKEKGHRENNNIFEPIIFYFFLRRDKKG